jgi:hypothetical protein
MGECIKFTCDHCGFAVNWWDDASFFAQTAQTSLGLIQNEIRRSAKGATPPLSMTSANLLKQSARNVGPVILIPENSMAYHDRSWP